MRIAGLASGMDIDSIVKDLMKAERMPLDKLKQKKQVLEWQRDDYRSLNTMLLSFRDKLSQLKLTPNYRARMATSSNDAKVSATVTSGASQASYSISEVKQLATAATRVNGGPISVGGKIDPTKSFSSQPNALGTPITWEEGVVETKTVNVKDPSENIILEGGKVKSLNVKVNGQTMKIVTGTDPLKPGQVRVESDGKLTFGTPLVKDSVVKIDYALEEKTLKFTTDVPLKGWNISGGSINAATIKIDGTAYTMGTPNSEGIADIDGIGKINITTGAITFDPEIEAGKEIEVTYKQNYSTIDIDTHTSKGEVKELIYITGNDSLNSVIRKVNESNAGVTMFYDSFKDQITLTRKETGEFNKSGAEINVTGDFMNKVLKFEGSTETGGQNAIFTINGLETERNTNTFDMSGVTFTLKQTFDADPSATVSVTIGNDTNKVFDNIKAFVDQYNELIAEIGKKLNEERHRSYKPLTDEERDTLSEKQQEKWEEMARSGLLKGDPMLSSVLSAMRLDMSSNVETNGIFKQLASIGIKTTANYMEGGKLEIDETKLKAALEQDPESVENLFRGPGTGADRGIVHKLYDTVDTSMKKLQEKAGRATSTNQQFALGRELLNVGKGIDRFEDKLKIVENRYWRQFTAMEKAIQRANEQSMYLMQQFSNF